MRKLLLRRARESEFVRLHKLLPVPGYMGFRPKPRPGLRSSTGNSRLRIHIPRYILRVKDTLIISVIAFIPGVWGWGYPHFSSGAPKRHF